MPNNKFEFKQFTIEQDRCAMKIGTDSILLGAITDFGKDENVNILDIGTGTGILAIMAAQKNHKAQITAIEVDTDASKQAQENVARTPWANRIKVENQDIRYYKCTNKYDIIISNPPFFENSLKSPDSKRQIARHTDNLSFTQIAECAKTMLSENGTMHIILPSKSENSFNDAAINKSLYLTKKTNIITKEGLEPKRVILSYKHSPKHYSENKFVVRGMDGEYTEQYKLTTKDFYLKL